MSTTTKKELIDRIADETGQSRSVVKKTVQSFLNQVIRELSEGNRLEFRDFGVFEMRRRSERTAQNPQTLKPIVVPASNTVRFKAGRLMKMALDGDIDPRSLTPLNQSEHVRDNGRDRRDGRAASRPQEDDDNAPYEVAAGDREDRR